MAERRSQGPRGEGRPSGGRSGDRRGGQGGSTGRQQASSGRGQGGSGRGQGPRRGDGGTQRGPRRDDRAPRRGDAATTPAERSAEQARYDGPPLDPEITGRELDRSVSAQLKGLPEKLAARVARHLVAAGQLIDTDPRTAYQHTLAARARAARIAVVREACGEAAYHAGEYAEALSELRAAKRMNGNNDYLPVIADCERALGRPEKALDLARNPAVVNLEDPLKAEMTIVEAGARRDLGQIDAALRTLEAAPLRTRSRADWVVRLRYTYADTLAAAGRTEEAVEWFHRTVGIDGNEITDAAERAAELESSEG
ncbi:tetratricopeptide repeat protein [Nocardioides iriomotensis]|uniref:Tetratricopeptide repeat protein n=1 Tax=Nocardioides iriomotensis TaxID=715784 RepID=A0A4Q5J5B0_9ACTN|nr:tetratricopeptide repeat protein [Nocardioides iriomotensis]RYU13028.1 tetratricopeptide repeat protein [Nocardioides iriomotensis]